MLYVYIIAEYLRRIAEYTYHRQHASHPSPSPYTACFAQNGLDLVPGIGDAGDRLYLGATAAEIAPPPDSSSDTINSDTRSDGEASAKKLKHSNAII